MPLVATCLAVLASVAVQAPPAGGPLVEAPRDLAVPERLTWVVHAYAAWSPDGRRLAFQTNAPGQWDLHVMSADGSGVTPIVTGPAADITPAWSPDGTRLAFVSERHGHRDVFTCRADGSEPRRLTEDPGQDIHPVWSHDGRRIIFSSTRGTSGPDDFDVWSMAADGTDLQQVTRGPEVDTYASWSPDGERIVLRRVIDGGNNEVFVTRADGSEARNLTQDPAAYDGWPAWSPDGRWIAFASGPGGRSPTRVWVMRPDGSAKRMVTDAPPGLGHVYDTQPAWSPDGRRLAFTRYRPGARESSELCVVDAGLPPVEPAAAAPARPAG